MVEQMTELNIHQRLALAMKQVTYIQKEKKQGMRYSIVSHDSVTSKVRPALLEAGIVYYPIEVQHQQSGNRTECAMTVRFVNIDDPQDFFDVETFGYGLDDQDKGPGKAMSYAVKYALLKTLGLETGDDPDEDQVTNFRNPVFAALELAISMSLVTSDLEQVSAQIKEKALHLSKPELATLRQMYLEKRTALEKE
jgi:hypothetical protein